MKINETMKLFLAPLGLVTALLPLRCTARPKLWRNTRVKPSCVKPLSSCFALRSTHFFKHGFLSFAESTKLLAGLVGEGPSRGPGPSNVAHTINHRCTLRVLPHSLRCIPLHVGQ